MLEAAFIALLIIAITAWVIHATSKDLQEFCANCGRNVSDAFEQDHCPGCNHDLNS